MFDFNLENVLETLGKGDSISMTRAEFVRDVPKALFLGYLLGSTGCSGGGKGCSTPEAAFFTLMNRLKNGELDDLDELLLNGAEHDLFYFSDGFDIHGKRSDYMTLNQARSIGYGEQLKQVLSNTDFDITRRSFPSYLFPDGRISWVTTDHFTNENVVVLNQEDIAEGFELAQMIYCVDSDLGVHQFFNIRHGESLEFIRVDKNWKLRNSVNVIPGLLALASAAEEYVSDKYRKTCNRERPPEYYRKKNAEDIKKSAPYLSRGANPEIEKEIQEANSE